MQESCIAESERLTGNDCAKFDDAHGVLKKNVQDTVNPSLHRGSLFIPRPSLILVHHTLHVKYTLQGTVDIPDDSLDSALAESLNLHRIFAPCGTCSPWERRLQW